MNNLDDILYKKFVVLVIYLTFIISSSSTNTDFLVSRIQRDTYDEREKLISTYKIISKTQCLLQMDSSNGYVHAKHITNLDDTNNGKYVLMIFLRLNELIIILDTCHHLIKIIILE
jgi:hypothetical protein